MRRINLTTFLSLLDRTNLTPNWDAQNSTTIFAPTNAAFAALAASGTNLSTISTQTLENHILVHKPGFVGYLPDLKDGATFATQGGGTITITVKNNVYFVNGARIVKTNIVTESGVIHEIDGVLTLNSTAALPTSNVGAVSNRATTTVVGALALIAGLLMVFG
jgi:uncharacterized surface protein with fasciclin (FAS1) repeats